MAGSEFVSGIYVASDYVDDTYTAGTYVDPGYVTGIVSGTATLTSQFSVTAIGEELPEEGISTQPVTATLSADGVRTRDGSSTIDSALQFTISANATKRPIADITANFTQTSQAERTRNSSADLYTNPDAWENMGTWDRPNQEHWQTLWAEGDLVVAGQATLSSQSTFSVIGDRRKQIFDFVMPSVSTQTVDAIRTRNIIKTVSASATLSADGVRRKIGSVTMANALNFVVEAFRTRSTAKLIASLGTMTVSGERTRQGTTLEASLGTMTVAGRKDSTPQNIEFTSQATLSADADRTRNGATLTASFGTLSADGVRVIEFREVIMNVTATVSVAGRKDSEGTVLNASSGTMSIDAFRTRNRTITLTPTFTVRANSTLVTGNAELPAISTVSASANLNRAGSITASSLFAITKATGVILTNGKASLSAFNTVLSALTIYKIDPYRVYTVKTEDRTLIIEAESRKKLVKSENRVNTIQEETRISSVKSETRQLEIQNLTLTDVAGTPLDTRK